MISCGLDSTLRLFDYERQSQLIYVSPCPLEACGAITNDMFVGAGDQLLLFSRKKRAPLFAASLEDLEGPDASTRSYAQKLFTAVATLQGYNIVAAAAAGVVYLLQLEEETLALRARVPLPELCFINSMLLLQEGTALTLFGCYGPERRWDRIEHLECKKGVFSL